MFSCEIVNYFNFYLIGLKQELLLFIIYIIFFNTKSKIFLNQSYYIIIWKEAQEDGKKKDKWDGNGKKREWDEKNVEKERPKAKFLMF